MPDGERGAALLEAARRAIAEMLGIATPEPAEAAADLRAPGSTFVTLTTGGRLRGCIGTLSFDRPLIDDVRANAIAAALRDPRFRPLDRAEYPDLRVEVSVLRAPRPLPAAATLEEAAALLRPGFDGVILERGLARGVFLPQVWDNLPEPRRFLRQLRLKAGLPEEGWEEGLRLWRFGVDKYREAGIGG